MIQWIADIFKTKDSSLLDELLDQGAVIVDVRTQQEFNSGSVEGAINIPLSQLSNEVEKLSAQANIILFCRSGARSHQAYKILKNKGMERVYNAGGLRQMQTIINHYKSKTRV